MRRTNERRGGRKNLRRTWRLNDSRIFGQIWNGKQMRNVWLKYEYKISNDGKSTEQLSNNDCWKVDKWKI